MVPASPRQVAFIGHRLLEVDHLACLMLPQRANPLTGQVQAHIHEVCSFAEIGVRPYVHRRPAGAGPISSKPFGLGLCGFLLDANVAT